jgi:PAS domain S-box-containing protein
MYMAKAKKIHKRTEEGILPAGNGENFRAIFEAANDGIVCLDEKTKNITLANPEFCRLTGYAIKELLKLNITDIIPKESVPATMSEIKKVISNGNHFPHEVPILGKGGKIISCEMRGAVFTLEGRRLILGFFRDVSRRKEIEEELKGCIVTLENQRKMLEQKNSALAELVETNERNKNKIKEDIAKNIETFVMPMIRKIKMKGGTKKYVDLLKNYLNELSGSLGAKVTQMESGLSPKEIEIAGMIRTGLSSKEISSLLNISYKTVNRHRRNIRSKFGISHKKVNLTTFLQKI